MKRILPWAIIGVFFVSIASSCASSKQNCDAYGNIDTKTEQSDLAQH
ncbi:MAG TPA: hypothetical protein VKX29_02130 [Brumimicrobium sp.]|nr:hypothetical protein [Brumimicrobium sp.]